MLSWPKSLFSVFSVKCYGKKQTNLWTNTIDRYLPESKSDFITSTWDCSIQLSLCDPTDCSLLGFPVLHQLLELFLMPTESMMPSNHLILCRPFLLPPSLFPSIRVFSSESVLPFRRPKYWSFSFSISPSNEYSGLVSYMVWSPYCPRDSQESSPTPQFKSINSLALSFLYSPTVTSIHDYWKNHSFD